MNSVVILPALLLGCTGRCYWLVLMERTLEAVDLREDFPVDFFEVFALTFFSGIRSPWFRLLCSGIFCIGSRVILLEVCPESILWLKSCLLSTSNMGSRLACALLGTARNSTL